MAPTPSNTRPPDEPLMVIAVAACAGVGLASSTLAAASTSPAIAARARTSRRRRYEFPTSDVLMTLSPSRCRYAGALISPAGSIAEAHPIDAPPAQRIDSTLTVGGEIRHCQVTFINIWEGAGARSTP